MTTETNPTIVRPTRFVISDFVAACGHSTADRLGIARQIDELGDDKDGIGILLNKPGTRDRYFWIIPGRKRRPFLGVLTYVSRSNKLQQITLVYFGTSMEHDARVLAVMLAKEFEGAQVTARQGTTKEHFETFDSDYSYSIPLD